MVVPRRSNRALGHIWVEIGWGLWESLASSITIFCFPAHIFWFVTATIEREGEGAWVVSLGLLSVIQRIEG